jgi:hypothetical protein
MADPLLLEEDDMISFSGWVGDVPGCYMLLLELDGLESDELESDELESDGLESDGLELELLEDEGSSQLISSFISR